MKALRILWSSALGTGVVLLIIFVCVFLLMPYAQRFENYINPVKTDWKVTQKQVEGLDLIISGTMIKRRDCEYNPPPGARDILGNYLLVASSHPASNQSRPASPTPMSWGPWRVIGGANKEIQLYQIDRCHPFWYSVTVLGTVQ